MGRGAREAASMINLTPVRIEWDESNDIQLLLVIQVIIICDSRGDKDSY